MKYLFTVHTTAAHFPLIKPYKRNTENPLKGRTGITILCLQKYYFMLLEKERKIKLLSCIVGLL